MSETLRKQIRQSKPIPNVYEEVFLGLCLAAQRLEQPWNRFLQAREKINSAQYNMLRILRGAGPRGITVGDLTLRMINRDSDVTPLVELLVAHGLVVDKGSSSPHEVNHLAITGEGLAMLRRLDDAVAEMPERLLHHMKPRQLTQLDALLGHLLEGDLTYP